MSAIATLPSLSQIGSIAAPAKVLAELTKAGDYLERIQLFQGTSSAAKQNKIRAGHYGIPRNSGEDIEELGERIDVLVAAARAKALDTNGETPVAAHDPESAEFKRIKEQADTVEDSGCMYGVEFLVFERSTGKFYTYFAAGASARREAGKMLPTEETGIRPITMSVRFIEKRYSWHAPVATKCSTPFTNAPGLEEFKAQVEKFFKSDNEGGREEVKPAAAKGRRAR